ncbi:dTDP-4-dehydrorhamnose reductase [Cupriavidus nantongensis]|uniref:dTDP-4-dehydrorhamnose reductase n=1 Tax=Cupriavidus nantongensis TaxID=1796606 RepID=UPI0022477A3F|nr:dTDP-4-dehydrorhamnose reductase [Cupriavidus nantongensis]
MQPDAHDAPIFLVTGCNGQVGFELRRSLAPLGRIVAVDRTTCDMSRPGDIRRVMESIRPDVVVNAAAYTAVDKAESDADTAFAVNATAVGVLAEAAQALGSVLVHYSTDYVFDGVSTRAYTEQDVTNPQSVYGKSKLAGEEAILANCGRAIVLRTSWVAGAHGANFAKTMLRLARERSSLRVIADQYGAPTTAALIADVTAQILGRRTRGNSEAFPSGIYHLAAAGETSWHGYATEVVRYAIAKGATFSANPASIEAISSAEYPLPAPRPASSRLDTRKLRETFGIYLPDWQQGVHHLLDQILN